MVAFLQRVFTRTLTFVVSTVKKLTTLATLFSFPILFVLFFYFLCTGEVLKSFACLAGIYTFIHLNKIL